MVSKVTGMESTTQEASMTRRETIECLRLIDQPAALRAEIEYELEDEGLITTDDGPYAKLTAKGRRLIAKGA